LLLTFTVAMTSPLSVTRVEIFEGAASSSAAADPRRAGQREQQAKSDRDDGVLHVHLDLGGGL
jgi:hypothetical protein